MDIYCPKCGEPCDQDELHVPGQSYDQSARIFRTEGCGILFDGVACRPESGAAPTRAAILQELADLLGDDVDGYAAMCEALDL
jgi:hypothetical protein